MVIHVLAHRVLIGPSLPTPCRCLPTSADSLRAAATPPAVLSNRHPAPQARAGAIIQARSPLHFSPSKSAPSPRRSSAIKRHGRAPRFARKGGGVRAKAFPGGHPPRGKHPSDHTVLALRNVAFFLAKLRRGGGVQKAPRLKIPRPQKGPSFFFGGARETWPTFHRTAAGGTHVRARTFAKRGGSEIMGTFPARRFKQRRHDAVRHHSRSFW